MANKHTITSIIIGLLLTNCSFGQIAKTSEYLGVAAIRFDRANYNLAWTSHPTASYYKQEYVAKGDSVERFKKLILLEVLTGEAKLNTIVAAKIAALKKMKASNPVVNFETFEKDGEVMLDFLVSESASDGEYLSVVERNVYRYKSIVEKNGQNCVLLFGVSERAYGDDIDNFFKNLKAHRFDLINFVGGFALPEIAIVK